MRYSKIIDFAYCDDNNGINGNIPAIAMHKARALCFQPTYDDCGFSIEPRIVIIWSSEDLVIFNFKI
jgi:hypothetical protein